MITKHVAVLMITKDVSMFKQQVLPTTPMRNLLRTIERIYTMTMEL